VTATTEAIALARTAAAAAGEKKADNVIAFDVSGQLVITDIFLLASAPNERQVLSIVDAVEEQARLEHRVKPIRREGEREGRWVLLDFGDVVVHVMHDDEREFYALERLWKDCPTVELPADLGEGAGPA
jgi:ribosome-associated protein